LILQGLAAAEIVIALHLQDFETLAVFEFFCTIRQKRVRTPSMPARARVSGAIAMRFATGIVPIIPG
jgi:hypothetical protein